MVKKSGSLRIEMVIKVRKSGVKSGAFPNPSTQFTKENAAYYGAKGGKKVGLLRVWLRGRSALPSVQYMIGAYF